MIRADLHVHTYYSDGLYSPAGAVEEAKRNGVGLIAVTDHDCILSYPEVCASAEKAGLKAVSGIEVSAYVEDIKIHTLGYGFDGGCTAFKQFCSEMYETSLKRADDIISKLNKAGVKLTMEDVLKKHPCENSPIHVMHVAAAGAEKVGAKDKFAFYWNYLAYGRCAFSCICRPSPEKAVEVINACGGFASLAHPARIEMSKEDLISLIKRLKGAGLGGIEGVYSTHTVTETAYYKEMAKAFNLTVTGGSDTHYYGGSKRIGTPVFYVDEALAEKLKI